MTAMLTHSSVLQQRALLWNRTRVLPGRKWSSRALGLTIMEPDLSPMNTLCPGCLYIRPNLPRRGTMSQLLTTCQVSGHSLLYSLHSRIALDEDCRRESTP